MLSMVINCLVGMWNTSKQPTGLPFARGLISWLSPKCLSYHDQLERRSNLLKGQSQPQKNPLAINSCYGGHIHSFWRLIFLRHFFYEAFGGCFKTEPGTAQGSSSEPGPWAGAALSAHEKGWLGSCWHPGEQKCSPEILLHNPQLPNHFLSASGLCR